MSDESPDQIQLPDGSTVDVAEDPESGRFFATGLTVSASETVSTGDYESYNPHVTLKTAIRPVIDLNAPGGLEAIHKNARRHAKMLARHLDDTIEAHPNTDRQPEFEQ